MKYSKMDLEVWIDHIIVEPPDKLSAWEWDFVDSVSEQLQTRGSLSDRQVEILERIYSEKTR